MRWTPNKYLTVDYAYVESSASFQMLLPSIKLNDEIGREKNIYTSVRKGRNPGGFNALTGVENFESGFDEEYTLAKYGYGSGATSDPVIDVFGLERTFGINVNYTF